MVSIGGFNAEFGNFTVGRGIRHDQGLAADRAVLDIRLLGNRQIKGQGNGFPAMWARGLVALDEDHVSLPL
jgi:hypothetical protein